MTASIGTRLAERFRAVDVSQVQPRRLGRLVALDSGLLEIEGLAATLATAVDVEVQGGHYVQAEIIGFREGRSLAMPFRSDMPLTVGATVQPRGIAGHIDCGPAMLGRVFGGLGEPIDGKPMPRLDHEWPLAGLATNPLDTGRVTRPFDCGVRAINALLTLGRGQRVAIIAGSGVGKSVLMGQMLAGSECDVIVAGLIGERAREVSDFLETKLPPEVRRRAVVIATAADEAPLLRLKAAMRATAIAEYFRAQGKNVLLLIDSLTRVAHAQREIGLTLGEPAALKGYPPSALSLIPRLVERAGCDRKSGGAITALYTVLADGGDLDDPVVDAARAIVDGHIILSRSLAEAAVYPAIDIGRSLSRVMNDVADRDQVAAAARFRQLWATNEENRDLVLMGAYTAGSDPLLDEALARMPEMRGFIAQQPDSLCSFEESRSALVEAFAP